MTVVRTSVRREVVIVGGVLALCPLVALIEPGSPAGAIARAHRLLAVEDALGIDVEAGVHTWLVERPTLRAVAEVLYLALHVSALVGVFAWSAATAPASYLGLRRLFVASHVITVLAYLRWPTAPPRLVDIDPLATEEVSAGLGGLVHHLQYEYAAIPSGHVVFAVVVAVGLRNASSPLWRAIGAAYPFLVTVLIVATGHHLLLDAVLGALVVAAAHVVLSCLSVVQTPVGEPVEAPDHSHVSVLGAAAGSVPPAARERSTPVLDGATS